MKKFNVKVPKKYMKDGEEKTAWGTVGKLTFFPKTETKESGFVLELYMFPDTKFAVFKEEPKEEPKPQSEDDEIPF